MRVFDASSIIYAWDNYPIEQFPRLWDWMAKQIANGELVIVDVAFKEVIKKSPECAAWLKEHKIDQLEITNAIAQDANRIKLLLGIQGDDYHSKGVGENDILIIAAARQHSIELITDEARQKNTPDKPSKRKIPSVCDLPEVAVRNINFIEYIKQAKAVF